MMRSHRVQLVLSMAEAPDVVRDHAMKHHDGCRPLAYVSCVCLRPRQHPRADAMRGIKEGSRSGAKERHSKQAAINFVCVGAWVGVWKVLQGGTDRRYRTE